MKKLPLLIQIMVMAMLYSSLAYADDDDWDDQGYYAQPQINYYYPQQPQANYYPPQPQYYGYDQRSHQGLAGGVIGSILGYELGAGNPLASGLGAAAGSFVGNGYSNQAYYGYGGDEYGYPGHHHRDRDDDGD